MPHNAPLEIAVVGCGTAGPAAALFLSRAGHRVTMFERVPEPGPVGAGIVLQPIGQAVLGRLGLLPQVAARGARVERLLCETERGRTIFDLSYATLEPRLTGYGLHRGVLFEALFDAVRHSPVTLRCGVSIDRIEDDGGTAHVIDEAGRRHGPYQLVVVADGARSRLRPVVRTEARVRPYRWGALWFIGEDPEGQFAGRLHQIVRGTERMLGLLPTGLGPSARGTKAKPLVTLFWSLRADRFDEVRMHLDAWKREVRAHAPMAGSVLDQIESAEQITFSSYNDVTMRRWGARSVVYLGDAAHAMSPQLGQGCNLALYDAMILADCFQGPAPLERYTHARRRHLGFYQLATRALTPFFQSDARLLGWVRDRFMAALSRVPFVHREMVRSMTGLKLGWLTGTLPPVRMAEALERDLRALPGPSPPPSREEGLDLEPTVP
ncbi:FAD-dependent monooxygenase [Pendulispora rubella]|uniref:FAD-dependent monooxygenase n=1 Tax=Pendulispora rubella TaxID=2741070 RepID=A0ABZ2LI71_9BACT